MVTHPFGTAAAAMFTVRPAPIVPLECDASVLTSALPHAPPDGVMPSALSDQFKA